MNDPHRLDPGRPPAPTRHGGGTALRPLLWVVLIVSATINLIGNSIGDRGTLVGTAAGIVAICCIAGLIRHHFVRRHS